MENFFNLFQKPKNPSTIKAFKLGIASPEQILEWSYGEVKKPETINYRTFKPERSGLFCGAIFGPIKDYECICGKYKRMKHRGVVCEKCGTEVIESKVRRERMGHIKLATPVAHIWFLKSLPSRIGAVLDLTLRELERVLYYESYVVLDAGETPFKVGQILSEAEFRRAQDQFGAEFTAGMGAESIKELLVKIDLEKLRVELRTGLEEVTSEAKRKKYIKRLRVVESFCNSENKPDWMIMDVVPVLPPDLRPLVPLDGGRFATSDLNDLYRRVINRNNRLKRLQELDAPEIILRNEKRMLQEAVDSLFDNGRRGKVVTGTNKRPLKSLSDMIKGKQGRFRQNLLGKRVDYSGRSVIVVGPNLRLHQCGLPKKMALELFKPFIFNKLEERGYVSTIKAAKRMVELEAPEVYDVLEEVIKEHPVMLNRAPTLHRLGIQAFEPVLIEGKAIQLHPLVCTAFNADFDGDQMAVHIPLSIEAQVETRVLMMSTNNLLSPANGKPIISPTQDIVLGLYSMTREEPYARGEGKTFLNADEVKMAYENGVVDLNARIFCRIDNKKETTTAGRVIVRSAVPDEVPFSFCNKELDKKTLAKLVEISFKQAGQKKTVLMSDRLKNLGFEYATRFGISIAMKDMTIPATKTELLANAKKEVKDIEVQYAEGIITDGERYNKVVDIWTNLSDRIAKDMMSNLGVQEFQAKPESKTKAFADRNGENVKSKSFNTIFMMADSGARGSNQQIRQLAGMRGLMAKPSGEIIETPIISNFREGLTVLEYFISTHGARKGLADTALKTANAGYLTRRLVDVAQDSIIMEPDCGTLEGIEAEALVESGEVIEPLGERILGRTALFDVKDPVSKKTILKANEEFSEETVAQIEALQLSRVAIRSPLTCKSRRGLCILCYGRDLARGNMVNIGEAVGIIAAQSIGEPGTQLTMRTFHIGGTASAMAEQSTVEIRHDGKVKFLNSQSIKNKNDETIVMNRSAEVVVVDNEDRELERHRLPSGARLKFAEGSKIKAGQIAADWDPYATPILTEFQGRVKFEDLTEGTTFKEQRDAATGLSRKVVIEHRGAQDYRPRILIVDPKTGATLINPRTNTEVRYWLPLNSTINVSDGQEVLSGDVLAKIAKETTKSKDITGGLPRVAELFEARAPREHAAIIADVEGFVAFGKDTKGKRKVIVTPEKGEPIEYLIPKARHIIVREGDFVRAGEALVDGAINPHDILRVLGVKALAKYLVDEIQEVYRLQGVKINDKHMEAIVRQMLRKVRILNANDSMFLEGEPVSRWVFEEANEKLMNEGKKPATAEPMLLGITKAALNTDSMLSAASFQETTKVFTEAAIASKVDNLYGLKENIIMGRLLPAGTGLPMYQAHEILVEGGDDEFFGDVDVDTTAAANHDAPKVASS
ncbi:MAG: DNA-directed RNA polymerase subunit beta' [Deltaproteobacteria bacterium]|nr:DNA-directed RNA polymerase subunit beta' [Deltaproteobacteria bacterium]